MSGRRLSKRESQTGRRNSAKNGDYTIVQDSSPGTSRSQSPASSSAITTDSAAETAVDLGETTDENETPEPEPEILTHEDTQLFQLVKKRRVEEVRHFLAHRDRININRKDAEGKSVLLHAVCNADEDMVDILLRSRKDIAPYDALMEAIKENQISIVQKMFSLRGDEIAKSLTEQTNSNKGKSSSQKSEFYRDDITPMIMAAVSGHYEIIEFLHFQGHELGTLHFPSCRCDVCGQLSENLKRTNIRMHILEAQSNASYIAFMAGVNKDHDPILSTFKICDDIERCIAEEPEFREKYEEILENAKKLPVDLLDQCRNEEETRIVLQKEGGKNIGAYTKYPRLTLAIASNHREFVSHRKTQDILYQEWIDQPWFTTSQFQSIVKNFSIVLLCIFAPIVTLIASFLCIPSNAVLRFIKSPLNRFRYNFVWHVIFLLLVFTVNSTERASSYLGPPSYYLPYFVGVFIVGNLISLLKHFCLAPSYFISSGWNIFEGVNHILFIIVIAAWAVLHSRHDPKADVKREELGTFDLILITEVITAVASAMAGLMLLRGVTLHKVLGPLQIALGRMLKEILVFVGIFSVIIVAFSLGAQHLFKLYFEDESCSLCKFITAMELFFWGLFTMSDIGAADIPAMEITGTVNRHILSQIVGQVLFVMYHIVCVTFFMNMLTGVINNTYNATQENVNVEWKYERGKLWVYYIQDTEITIPLNIFPNISSLFGFLGRKKENKTQNEEIKPDKKLAAKTKKFLKSGYHKIIGATKHSKRDSDRAYAILMRGLIQRYFRAIQLKASEDVPVLENVQAVLEQVTKLKKMTAKLSELA